MTTFYVFFDREIVEREKVDLSFLSPWNATRTPGYEYMVLCSTAEKDPRYKELDKDRRFVKKVASGN